MTPQADRRTYMQAMDNDAPVITAELGGKAYEMRFDNVLGRNRVGGNPRSCARTAADDLYGF